MTADSGGLPRIAVVSTSVPPAASGQARVLAHLLGSPAAPNCLMLTDQPPFAPGAEPSNYRSLTARQALLGGWTLKRVPRLDALLGAGRAVLARARDIQAHVGAFEARAIVACTASPFDLPASMLVARRCRVPLIVYLFDDPVYQWVPGPLRSFAKLWEPLWSRTAAAVIAPNESMAETFAKRRGRRPVLVRNPVAPGAFGVPDQAWPAEPGRYRIVYTGSVYHAHTDAFLDLLVALESLPDWSLHVYTSQSEAELAAYGIKGANVIRHDHVEQAASYAVQQAADVLFLPLAFRSTIQEVLRTAAPGKLGEYLASGQPIMAHAPPESFVVQHLAQHQAGYIVDSPNPPVIMQALRQIVADPVLRATRRENATRLAQTYAVDHARDLFWSTVNAAINGQRK